MCGAFLRRHLVADARTGPGPGGKCAIAAVDQAEKDIGPKRITTPPMKRSFRPMREAPEEPLTIAVSIEKGGSADERVQANSSA